MHVLLCLTISSFFFITPRYIVALLMGTLLLPAKPVLWQAFNKSWCVCVCLEVRLTLW